MSGDLPAPTPELPPARPPLRMSVLPPARPPFPVAAPYRVVPAPRPLDGPSTVELDDAWPAALRRRLERLLADPRGVIVHEADLDDAGLAAAVRAAWDLLPGGQGGLALLGMRVDRQAQRLVDAEPVAVAAPDSALVAAARDLLRGRQGLDLLVTGWLLACSDDLVVLRRSGRGELRAELLAVAFPSGWPPRCRAGASLTELHAPVADGERLRRAAPALSEALLLRGPLRQHVWGLDPDGRLDRDPSAPDAPSGAEPADPSRWWLRVERQTSVPLVGLDRALFTIRPHLVALTALTGEQCTTLAASVASMSPETLSYKGISLIAGELVGWLQFRSGLSG